MTGRKQKGMALAVVSIPSLPRCVQSLSSSSGHDRAGGRREAEVEAEAERAQLYREEYEVSSACFFQRPAQAYQDLLSSF